MAELNSTILDSVWLAGTNDYQQRIPQATQHGIAAVSDALFAPMNRMFFNQFMDSLIMRIGNTKIHSKTWRNPLGNLKGDMLQYGNTIQEWAPKWIRAHSYGESRISNGTAGAIQTPKDASYFASDMLNVYKPEGQAWYHSVNRQDKYPISIDEPELRRAFVDEYGLNSLINSILEVPMNSDAYDEYRIMLQLTSEYFQRWGGYVDVLSASPETEAGAKELLTKVRTYTGLLRFPSARYNASAVDVPVFVNPDELILLTTPQYEAYLDVNVLSATFHVELADIDVRRVIVDEFPVANCAAMLVSKDWFVVHDKVFETNSFYLPSELVTTYWLHHWEVCSCSPYVPCIYFMYGAGSASVTPTVTQTVTGLTVDEDEITLAAGQSANISFTLTGTISPTNENFRVAPDSVTFDFVNGSNGIMITPAQESSTTSAAVYTISTSAIDTQDGTFSIVATTTYTNPSTYQQTEHMAGITLTIES